MSERPDQPFRERKNQDRALVLPIVGLILLTPPVAAIFQLEGKIGGIPVALVYVFVVWAGLIAGAAILSRHLHQDAEPDRPPDEPAGRD